MADKSGNFLGGFILGTIAGSALGVFFGSKLNKVLDPDRITDESENEAPLTSEEIAKRNKRGLEKKIAQLNEAIDAVSQELTTSESNGKSPVKSSQLENL
jgi:gas vesicle protein